MQLSRLVIRHLRALTEVTLAPAPGLNLLLGENGAGKTSVLEAIHLLSYGRSFRGRVRDGLVQAGAPALEVYAQWPEGAAERRAGLRHDGQAWTGRLDGVTVQQLGELCAAVTAVTFEPGSHALVGGSGDPRRRFMDWGLFHVEPGFILDWRRYARALRQRNVLLKTGANDAQLDAWDLELVAAGEPLARYRQQYIERLDGRVAGMLARLSPGLGAAQLTVVPGWKQDEMCLADALLQARHRDRSLGYTTVGPHRGDWRVTLSALPGLALSRGQAKLVALGCLLAQAEDLAAVSGAWPLVALDDLASELDQGHRERVVELLLQVNAQVFITGTELAVWPAPLVANAMRFHVEQGTIRAG